MKLKLLLLSLFSVSFNLLAQQNIWIGTEDDLWSNENNWTGTVPAPSDDVLIPSGFVVTLDSPADILSIEIQGNSVFNVTSSLIIANPSEFEDNVVVNWSSGDLSGGGILLNSGTINLSFPSFDISDSTVLNNPGTINLVGGNIGLSSDSVLNNSGTGIIDFKTNNGLFSASSGDLINYGTIKTSFPNPSDQGFISCDIINQDGIFQIDSGSLNLNNTSLNFMGGEFNISADATLNINSPMSLQGTLFGNVFGGLNWNDDISVANTAVFNFSGNEIINCTGNLDGGGTLTNQTIINQIGGSALQINGSTTLVNTGTIQITNGPGISIRTNSIINNTETGTIDIQTNGAEINVIGAAPNVLNNSGLIKTSFLNQTDQSIFRAQLNNNDGTIEVDNGTLWLFNTNTTLTDGIYNIGPNAILKWTLPITISGALNGILDGTFGWEGDLLVPTSASLNFTGNGNVEWKTKSLSGGGTLTNEHVITTVSGSNKIIDGATTLINNADIKSSGFVRIGTNSTLSNSATGTIDIETFGSSFGVVNSAPHTFVNSGTIIASFPANTTFISAPLNNFGIIEAALAEIEFSNTLVNETTGIIKGAGIIDLPSSGNFTNNGVFAPGNSPGELTVIGDFSTNPSSQLDVELNGLIQGSEYDLLSITGNADFDGDVQITLGFSPNINDEFIVVTTSGSISTCSLPATKTADFGGSTFEFSVMCRNNDEVVLTVTDETLDVNSFEDNSKPIVLYPNPAEDIIKFSSETINRIEVYDIAGKLLIDSQTNSISTKILPGGMYLVKGTGLNKESILKKLIKK